MYADRADALLFTQPHLVLVFPPIWTPIAPHLAVSTLTAYLRQKGIKTTPIDANIDFFARYILSPEILRRSLSRADRLLHGGNGGDDGMLPVEWKEMLKRELPLLGGSSAGVDDLFSSLRLKERFLQPDLVLPALDRVLGFLRLHSAVHWPEQMTLSNYYRDDVLDLKQLLERCTDPERNVFLPFFEERVLPEIRRAEPSAVGISISSGQQFFAAMTLGRLVRAELPEVHVVVGGQRLIDVEEKVLGDPFAYKHFFHSAVLYEGERPLEALLRALSRGKTLHEVPNLLFLDGDRVATSERGAPVPLEELPHADYADTPWDRYLMPVRYAPFRMAEGCYWGKCTFCGRNGPERAVFCSPARVLDELQCLRDAHGVSDISVNDDCLPPSYWREIAEGIIKRRLDLSMFIYAKPVKGFTSDLLKTMARAGVKGVRWGIESAHPRVLKLMRKGTEKDASLRVLRDACQAGVWNHACLILGFPGESREEAGSTLSFVRSNANVVHSFSLYPFELLKKSYIYKHPDEFGIREIRYEATPLRDQISFKAGGGMPPEETRPFLFRSKKRLLDESYGWPLWYHLKMREYLQLYLHRYGLEGVLKLPFRREGLRRLS